MGDKCKDEADPPFHHHGLQGQHGYDYAFVSDWKSQPGSVLNHIDSKPVEVPSPHHGANGHHHHGYHGPKADEKKEQYL